MGLKDFDVHGLAPLLEGVAVEGRVMGPDGPLTSGAVHVYSAPVVVDAPIAADGTYRATGLPPGEVLSWVFAAGYGLTYYPDVDRPTERLEILEEGETRAGVDLTVPYQSVIEGRLVGEGDLSDVTVLAYNDERTVGVGAAVEADRAPRLLCFKYLLCDVSRSSACRPR